MSSCQTHNLKEKHNKIRKRACSSSSSSSSVRRYRFKQAILVGKKGVSSTPVPMRKNTRRGVPSIATHHHDPLTKAALPCSGSALPCNEKELSVSARKLAATLWEINDLPPSKVEKDLEAELMRTRKKMIRSRDKDISLSRSGLLQPNMSDPSYNPFEERMKGFEVDSCKRRVSALSNQLQLADYYLGGLDAHSSTSLMKQVVNQPRNKKNCGKCTVGVKNRLKEARSGLSTSKKLLKVLNQMCLQDQHSTSIPLILALGSELDRVCNQIDQQIQEQSLNQNDIECLMKCYAEAEAAWKRREREKVRKAITCVAEELEVEKKLRRQTERLNKKIAKEMANVKASHLKATNELEREKRAKEVLEQICDELARGIGEDKAQVEELKRESAKIREEVEKEREMLQLADVLREERVQMKLSEAKYQFEEKNAVLEELRNELEVFLRTKEEKKGDVSPLVCKKIKDLESYLNKAYWGFQIAEKENDLDVVRDGVEHEGDDSADSGLRSIELNMDKDNRSYKWSYACENAAQDDSKRVSIDKKSIERKSFSERIQWGSISFNKGNAICKKRDLDINIQGSSDKFDRERSIEFLLQDQIRDDKDETESYRPSIMSLQDCMSCANPAQRSDQSLTFQYTNRKDGDTALGFEGDNLKQEAAARKSGC